mgnify:CR=1 FL=1
MRKFKLAGACFALLSVVLGAFASHFLKSYLDIQKFDAFETGIRYMMYHGLSMLIIGGFEIQKNILIFHLFFWGTILFSFSIFPWTGSFRHKEVRTVSGWEELCCNNAGRLYVHHSNSYVRGYMGDDNTNSLSSGNTFRRMLPGPQEKALLDDFVRRLFVKKLFKRT